MTTNEAILALYQALRAEIGLVLRVTMGEVLTLRQLLYRIKTKSGDNALRGLILQVNPNDDKELWLIKPEHISRKVGRPSKLEDL